MPPRNLYTRALEEFGLDVQHVNRVLMQRYGTGYEGISEAELYSTLSEYTSLRGGLNIPMATDPITGQPQPVSRSEIMGGPVARQMALATSSPVGEAPEGYFTWGERAYDPNVLGYSLGYNVSGGQITMGAPIEKVKYWRQAGQQGPMAWFENLPVENMGILSQGANVPEPVQRVNAFLAMGPVGPEGTGYYDPNLGRQSRPFTERVMLPQSLDPSMLDIQVGQQIPTSGDPLPLFPGHTGIIEPRYESAQITQWDVQPRQIGSNVYNELVVQGQGYFPQGVDFPQKFGVKTEAVSMPGLQESMGVQYMATVRDPVLATANIVGMMSPEQRQQAFGRDIERWTPDLYQEAVEKLIVPNLQERWMPQRTYQVESPITQALLQQGALRDIQPVGNMPVGARVDPSDPFRTGMIQAQQRVVGFEAPFGIQPGAPWMGRSGVLGREVARDIQRVQGQEFYQHLENIAAPARSALEQVGGAYLANVSPESQFLSVGAEKIGWESAYGSVIEQLAERGISPEQAEPGLVGQMLMRSVGNLPEVQGKGIAFPNPEGGQTIMPNPAAVERWGGQSPVEGMPWGFFRRYSQLMEAYAKQEAGSTSETRARYGQLLGEAFGASEGSLSEITASPAFKKAAMGGLPIGRARMGGRFAPMEDLPENRFFMGKEMLMRGLAPHVAGGVDVAELAENIITGKEAGPRAMFFRDPLTMPEEQLGVGLEFMSFPELQKVIPGITREQYETMGASARISSMLGPAQGGDFDRDWYEMILGTRYTKGGMEHLVGRSSVEDIRKLAEMHPAGEVGSLVEKLGKITTVEQAAEIFRGAQQTHSFEDVAASFQSVVEGKAGMAPAYSAFRRRLSEAVRGESQIASRARSEAGVPYMTTQDLGKLEGPEADMMNMVMRLSGSKFGGVKIGAGEEIGQEDLFNLRNPAFAMPAAFRAMAQWGDVSPESRAMYLSGSEDPGTIRALAGEIEAYGGSVSERTSSIQRMMQLATGESKPTWERWAEKSPFAQVMYEGAFYRAKGKEGYIEGAAGAQLGARGAARQGLMETFYKQARPLEETVAMLEEAVEKGVVASDEAQIIRRNIMGMQVAPRGYVDQSGQVQGEQAQPVASLAQRAEQLSQMTPAEARQSAIENVVDIQAGAAGGAGGGMPPAGGGAPPATPPGGAGGGLPGEGPGFSISLPEGFRGKQWANISGDPQSGYQVRSGYQQPGFTGEQRTTIQAIGQYEDALKKRAAQLNEAIDAGRDLTKEEIKAGKLYGRLNERMQQASFAAGTPEQAAAVQEAQGTLGAMGAGRIGEYAGIQGELSQAGIIGGEGGGGGLFGGFRGLLGGGASDYALRGLVSWTPFQMRRVWQATGGQVFNQMIPAAAQAEMAGWQATQAMGVPGGGIPEGVAGGVMQWQAAQRQAQISGGRAGYRAWGAGVLPAAGLASEAQGIFAPALGAAGVGALAGFTLGGPLGGAIGAAALGVPAAAVGMANYVSSYRTPTAENMMSLWSPGFAPPQEAGISGAFDVAQHGLAMLATGLAGQDVGGRITQAQQLAQVPLNQQSQQERMASLNRLAQTMNAEGTVWAGMDEGQRLQGISQYAAYDPFMAGRSVADLQQNLPRTWISRAMTAGVSPMQYEGLAAQLQMGPSGAMQLTQQALQQPGAYERRGWEMAMQQYAPLTRFGFGWDQIDDFAQGGMLTGEKATQFQRLVGGDRYAWSSLARQGVAPMWAQTVEQGGLQIGTTTLQGLAPSPGFGLGSQAFEQGPMALWSQRGGVAQIGGGQTVQLQYGGAWGAQDIATAEQRRYEDLQTDRQWDQLVLGSRYQRSRWSIEDRQTGMQDAWQRQQFGFQLEGLQLGDRQFWESVGLQERRMEAQQERGGEDLYRTYSRGLTRLAWQEGDLIRNVRQGRTQFGWQAEDIATQTGRQQVQFGWQEAAMGRQEAQSATRYGWNVADIATGWERQQQQFGWQAQDIRRGWQQQQTQFGWAEEDLAQRRATSSLQFGWQQEDFEENIRFASGRARQRMMTQQERAVVMRNIDVGQMQTQEERMEEREKWAEEEHKLTLERFAETRKQADQDHDKALERLEEQRKWEEENQEVAREQFEQQREWAEEDHSKQTERLEERRRWLEQDFSIQMSRLDTQRMWLEEDYNRGKERHDEEKSWAAEELELRKKHHIEDMDLSMRRHEASVSHFEDGIAYREQLKQLDRAKWEEDFERSREALIAAEEHRDVLRENQDLQKEISRAQQRRMAEWNAFWADGGAFQAIFNQILSRLQDLDSRLSISP